MRKTLFIAALLSTPLLLNACQSSGDMGHSKMENGSMMHEQKMMHQDMKMMKEDKMMQNHGMNKGMM